MDAPGACPRGGIGNNTQLWLMYSVNLIESRHRGHWFPRQTREREREREAAHVLCRAIALRFETKQRLIRECRLFALE